MGENIRAIRKGWKEFNGTWYYFDNEGKKKTGWLNFKGTWYYLDQDGAMVHDTVIDGYRINSNGVCMNRMNKNDEETILDYMVFDEYGITD